MAQIMNINAAPIVSPDGAYLVALKNGRISRIDGKALSQDTEVKNYVDQEVKKLTAEYTKAIVKLEAEITEIKSVINSMFTAVQNGSAVIEPANETEGEAEEAPKAKTKKSKK